MTAALLAIALAFPHGTAVITTAHARVSVRVEIAATNPTREQGLMYRRSLAPRAGMAFVWPTDVTGAFWMKNTLIPLSIAFYDRRGRIVRMMDMAPCRADPCPVYDPRTTYRGALEVNRGAFKRWKVWVGDRIVVRRGQGAAAVERLARLDERGPSVARKTPHPRRETRLDHEVCL
jgi:uncharacterized protein